MDHPAPLRVLHLLQYFRPDFTGEGLYLERLAPLLKAAGVEADVAATATAAPAASPAVPASVRRLIYFGRRDRKPKVNLGLLWWLARHIRSYDAVHVHSPVDRYFLPHLLARLAGVRVVHSCTLDDGLAALVASYRPPFRPLVRRLCRLIDAAVAISPKLHADSVALLPQGRVHLIPQGVLPPAAPARTRDQARREAGFQADDVVLLFVGGICDRKDIRFLIDNHARLTGVAGPLKLMIVGPDLEDGYAAEMRSIAAGAEQGGRIAPGRIRFAGYQEDPSEAYRIADMFVFASKDEGFGNVVLEAMAFGLPVVTRLLPGVTDSFVSHGETGFLFENDDEYRAAVARLAADAALRKRIGDAARDITARRYDLRRIAEDYLSLYRGDVCPT